MAARSALSLGPRPHRPKTLTRARSEVLDAERLAIIEEAVLMARAVHGARALLASGAAPDAETTGRILAHVTDFVDDVLTHLTRKRPNAPSHRR